MSNLDYLKKYKLFIVDYDGTLLDSMPMWNKMLSNFLKSENIKFDIDIDELAKEQTNFESAEYINKNYFPELTMDELSNKMYDFVKKEYVKQLLKNNAIKLIKEFKKHGRVVLFSATDLALLNETFKINGIDEYLDYVYSASDMKTTKTNGIGFNKLLEIEKIDKSQVLFVEDVYHAIKGAINQKFDVLAIFDNQKSWENIKKISTYNLNLDNLN